MHLVLDDDNKEHGLFAPVLHESSPSLSRLIHLAVPPIQRPSKGYKVVFLSL